MKIATIQTNLHWENKDANLQMFTNQIQNIAEADMVILPEMFSTGFSMKPQLLAEDMQGPTIDWMRTSAIKYHKVIIGSIIIAEQGKFYNRLICMLPNGQHGYYDKRHLFAFAGEDAQYSPGNKRLIASVNGWKLNLQVCYDLRFPVWARQQASAYSEFDVLVYVANWPERRSHAWKTLLTARAIENQCYVIGVNRIGEDGGGIYHSGDTMLVDPLGEILYQKANEEHIAVHQLSKEKLADVRERFPFWKDADDFKISI